MATEIWLVRHGQSVSNAGGIWQGHGDSPLSDLGRAQVRALGRRLEGERFDLALASDLVRAFDTSGAYAGDVERHRVWREIDVGEWEGLTMPQVAERFPEQIEALKSRETFKVGGAESWPDLFARADGALDVLKTRLQDGQRAIVFSHGAVIAALAAGLAGARDRWPWPLGRMRNTAVTIVRFGKDRPAIVAHNDDSHLTPDLTLHNDVRDDQSQVRLLATNGAPSLAEADLLAAIETALAGDAATLEVQPAALVKTASRIVGSAIEVVSPAEGGNADILHTHGASVLLSLQPGPVL